MGMAYTGIDMVKYCQIDSWEEPWIIGYSIDNSTVRSGGCRDVSGSMSIPTDEELMQAVAERETNPRRARRALEELYNRYARKCLVHNYRLLHSRYRSFERAMAVSEDIMHQKFLKIMGIKRFDIREDAVIHRSARSYIFKIDHNECLNYLKRKHHSVEVESAEESFEFWEKALFDAGYGESNPLDLVESREQIERLNQGMMRLSGSQRDALYFWSQGYSYREIAVLTGKNESRVRGLIWHGLEKLRRFFKATGEKIREDL